MNLPALQITGLKKTYSNGVTAVKNLDLTIREGDFYALLGPNGAGKSTTIGIISSLVNKSAGQISVFGYDLDSQRSEAKSLIGLVPQEFNFNIFEPVKEILTNQGGYYGLPPAHCRKRADILLKQLGLWEKRKDIARNLSGGMKRRLMIARAMVHEPRLLILDEPTAGVDVEIRHSMWKFLKEMNQQGTTIILTTHYLEEAESLCRNIGIIDKGEIIENTTMRELLKRLQVETFVLDLADPVDPGFELDDFPFRVMDEQCIEVGIHKDQGLNQLFEKLSKRNIRVNSLRNKVNRLEELFMSLVKNDSAEEKM